MHTNNTTKAKSMSKSHLHIFLPHDLPLECLFNHGKKLLVKTTSLIMSQEQVIFTPSATKIWVCTYIWGRVNWASCDFFIICNLTGIINDPLVTIMGLCNSLTTDHLNETLTSIHNLPNDHQNGPLTFLGISLTFSNVHRTCWSLTFCPSKFLDYRPSECATQISWSYDQSSTNPSSMIYWHQYFRFILLRTVWWIRSKCTENKQTKPKSVQFIIIVKESPGENAPIKIPKTTKY